MKAKKVSLRKCVACQEMMPKKSFIRIVRTPDAEIKLDTTGKVSGRGAYLCPKKECLTLAKKKNAFDRSLKTKISNEVYLQLERQLQDVGDQENES